MGIGAQMVANMIAKTEGRTIKPLKEAPVQSVGGQMVLKMIEAYKKNMNK